VVDTLRLSTGYFIAYKPSVISQKQLYWYKVTSSRRTAIEFVLNEGYSRQLPITIVKWGCIVLAGERFVKISLHSSSLINLNFI